MIKEIWFERPKRIQSLDTKSKKKVIYHENRKKPSGTESPKKDT